MKQSFIRIAIGGTAAAVLVGVSGLTLERIRLGTTDEATVAAVEVELRNEVNRAADRLGTLAVDATAARDAIRDAPQDPAAARTLFDTLDRSLPDAAAGTEGITVYDRQAMPIAWGGRVSELPRSRIDGPAALFVSTDALGPRLIRIEPIADRDRPSAPRLGTVVVEQSLGNGQSVPSVGGAFQLSGLLVPVLVRPSDETATTNSPYSFIVPSSGGGPLIEAEVKPADVGAAHERWRGRTHAAICSVLALTLLVYAGALLEARRRTRTRTTFAAFTVLLFFTLLGVRALFWLATAPLIPSRSATTPVELLLNALVLAGCTWLLLDGIERWRVTPPRRALLERTLGALVPAALLYALAGAFDVTLLWMYERFLVRVVSQTTLNLLHFSLHPLNDLTRLVLACGLVLLHTGVVWTAALALRLAGSVWRVPRGISVSVMMLASWVMGAGIAAIVARLLLAPVPFTPLLFALGATVACALALQRLRAPLRRSSQAARLLALYAALVVPAIAMYPSLHVLAVESKERLVANTFAPQAASQREDVKRQLDQSLDDIDAMPDLPALIEVAPQDPSAMTNQAFEVWSKTALAKSHVTSAVELYGMDGRLISRFINLPEYDVAPHVASGCGWEAFEEVTPFGSSQRHVLFASRGICAGDRRVGAIVVRAMLDYRTLPFSASQSPYVESLIPGQQPQTETTQGRDIEFAVYGWSRAPLYASGSAVWPLPDAVFDRMVQSREPLWADIVRDGSRFRVYFFNDRSGIYALGYPVITWVGHLVNLAELVILTGALYVLLIGGATLLSALTAATPASGRALLREIRSSFYRKLFLAFVASAVVPVVILAIATRTYFANQFGASVEQDAVKTATIAERLVEDYTTLQRRGTSTNPVLDDQIMALVSRAIDEDVSYFEGPRLEATSERDLFASGLLSIRTPSGAFRKVVLERLPTFVGVENAGGSRYLLAAAPVRAGGHEGVVTVPLTLRERETDQQIDELDRGIWSASVLFVLLGAGLGYWMAERIADPVNRLTRATRRIARGDLDARIASTSSDELRRLVDDFNRMAADLKRQRAELERTQRLEAWADMARQVAHDIKNPLTPIQLSAEHAHRVNIDRGRPLSPVLDECVSAILKQVKLLRQIAAEFSSFASSPTPRPEPTDVAALVNEVVEPYRAGLSGRVAIDVQSESDLPQVSMDRTLFARALTNVIENALHAMPGGGTLTIRALAAPQLPPSTAPRTNLRSPASEQASARQASHLAPSTALRTSHLAPSTAPRTSHPAPRTILVQISDSGVGMDREALGKIFEPYFSTKATGTGLGLTIAKRNVELNGGTIEVESQRGAGTTVTIRLPAN